MLQARPTRAPAGRLLRLSLVLNPVAPRERLLEVARMGDRAGIGALWIGTSIPWRATGHHRPVPRRVPGAPWFPRPVG